MDSDLTSLARVVSAVLAVREEYVKASMMKAVEEAIAHVAPGKRGELFTPAMAMVTSMCNELDAGGWAAKMQCVASLSAELKVRGGEAAVT
jgi:hypothetical protein